MQQLPDPYRALGVARGATAKEIKAAHRKLAKRYHPDGAEGDARRFLKVQEAYRVLSDPLLRREWDERHAPGPVSARTAPGPAVRPRPTTERRRPAAPRRPAATSEQPPPPAAPKPRSSHAYTWSASEVPWWEDSAKAERRGPPRPEQDEPPRERDQPPREHDEPPPVVPDMDVYNRSSGAAWSMAARAYFRRGDKDLPGRGSFHHQGSQPLTGARARVYAEAEARRQAASPSPPVASANMNSAPREAYAYATAGVSRAPFGGRGWRSQSMDRRWPSLSGRLLLALVAWLPMAALATYAGSVVTGEEVGSALVIALFLGVLFALPRLAYFAARGTIGGLAGAAIGLAVVAILGARLPLSTEMMSVLALVGGVAYLAAIGGTLLIGSRSRPWSR